MKMALINIIIEGVSYQVEAGLTVLEAAKNVAMTSPLSVHTITANAQRVLVVDVLLKFRKAEKMIRVK